MTSAPIEGGSSRDLFDATHEPTVPGPPVVYLPVRLAPDGSLDDVAMLQLSDGQIALLGYSALDRLIACCGADQAWLLAGPEHLEAINRVKPYDVKLLDVDLPVGDRARLLRGA